MDIVRREDRKRFITADGSSIRELVVCSCAPGYSHADTVLFKG